jgi:hypothetical protein
MDDVDRRQLLVSKGWIQAVALVLLFGFFVMGLLAYRTYDAKPPIPAASSTRRGRRSTRAPTSKPANSSSCTTA